MLLCFFLSVILHNIESIRRIEPFQMSFIHQLKSLIQSVPGNNYCVDCQQPNPTWASVNIGAFLCLECCAIHRSLGVHISIVKSITLDKWTQEFFDKIKKKGNKAVNLFYEAKLPPDFQRPKDTESRRMFIRDKYENRLWVFSSNTRMETFHVKKQKEMPIALPISTSYRKKRIPPQQRNQDKAKIQEAILSSTIENNDFVNENLISFEFSSPKNTLNNNIEEIFSSLSVNTKYSTVNKLNSTNSHDYLVNDSLKKNKIEKLNQDKPQNATYFLSKQRLKDDISIESMNVMDSRSSIDEIKFEDIIENNQTDNSFEVNNYPISGPAEKYTGDNEYNIDSSEICRKYNSLEIVEKDLSLSKNINIINEEIEQAQENIRFFQNTIDIMKLTKNRLEQLCKDMYILERNIHKRVANDDMYQVEGKRLKKLQAIACNLLDQLKNIHRLTYFE